MTEWIEITYHEATEEEKEELGEEIAFVYDCSLPNDNEEVLVTTKSGIVTNTLFYHDGDSAYFEFFDEDEIVAWMPFPEPFKKAREQE